MTYYEKNLEVLKEIRNDLYNGIMQNSDNSEKILVGDALDSEKFLAIIRGEDIIPLNSTYHPTHEAIRYTLQFCQEPKDSTVLLFGFSNGKVIEQMLSEECPVSKCIVYEPSISIFKKALEEFDLSTVLLDTQLMILVEGINGNQLEYILNDVIDYRNWRHFSFKMLSQYQELFSKECRNVFDIFSRIYDNKSADMNTLIHFAQSGMINEIKSLQWMMDCKTLDGMIGKFPADMPYIIVAAGPSLERNVEILRQVKGKAFIVCVDTAVPFLLKRGIIPDMVCTVDAQKGTKYFEGLELHNLPIAISTDSDYRALELIGEVNPIYMSITNDFYKKLFNEKGSTIGYFDGGGSVATVCFQMGIEIGFKTIILMGQDLAFTDKKAHAGMGDLQEEDLVYNILMVDGYYGEKVMTRGDFKHYIDWYNLQIPELKDRLIINATEGGAKLKGTVQMPLQEAVDKYCLKEYDISAIMNQVPKVWKTKEEKMQLYQEIKRRYQYFTGFHRRLKDGIGSAERAICIIKRGNYQQKELERIDKKLDAITKEVETEDGMVILVKRMIETDITLNDDLENSEDNLELESIRLYEKMKKYLSDLLEALEELLPIWKSVMEEINKKYQFENES
ncbi:MAG: motility associated factor glycosyltransferase family protein [Lachnospiraceae bacterium]|nr:motility associated factor glycosyltransferase family protein [Lachnospiraceae bacterium]